MDEFAARLDPPLLRDLFKKMVAEAISLENSAPSFGAEDGIAVELYRAREQFVKQRKITGFLPGMEPAAPQGSLDLSGIDEDAFSMRRRDVLLMLSELLRNRKWQRECSAAALRR